jgi:hypothetical protein
MVFNRKLQKVMEEAHGIKPFNHDNVIKEKNEFKMQHNLLQVKLKALTMEEKGVDLW